ncbi:MAG: hypothetical protein ACXWLM_09800 [Myxococcales bacterium]
MRWLSLLLVLGCAHLKDDSTVCAESRGLRCLTREICAMDEKRGCQVCRCEAATGIGPDGKPTPPGPDQR